jgi:hypothetical protein
LIGLLVWQADSSPAARVVVIVVLAVGWSAASFRAGSVDRRGRDLGALAHCSPHLGLQLGGDEDRVEYAQPFAFSALRTFLGALSLFALLLVLRRPLRPAARMDGRHRAAADDRLRRSADVGAR